MNDFKIVQNKLYFLIEEDGDMYAEIRFHSSFSESNVEHALDAMAWATSTKWIEVDSTQWD